MPTPWIASMGQQAAQATLGAGMGLILGGIERKKQLEQQQKLQNMQIAGQMEMARFNQKQAMEMWEATNYKAQMEQLKKAGLNPGLIYGMGGAGGAIANPTPGQVTGGNATPIGPAPGMAMQMGAMQLQLLDAQKKNIQADTNNKRAETALKPLQGTQIEASTESLLQGIESSKTQQALTDVQTSIASIEEHVKGMGQNAAVATIMKHLEILNNDAAISNETKTDKIKLITAELKNKIADTLNKQKQTAKSDKEIQEIDQKIKLMNQEYDINKVDQDMAKEGFNPKAGAVYKLIHNLVKLLMGL